VVTTIEGPGVAALLHLRGLVVDEVAPGPADQARTPARGAGKPQQDLPHELRRDVHRCSLTLADERWIRIP
jgi:hypothetical protein